MRNNGPQPGTFVIVDGPSELNHFYTFHHPSAYINVQTATSQHTSKFIMQGWQTGSLSIGTVCCRPLVTDILQCFYRC